MSLYVGKQKVTIVNKNNAEVGFCYKGDVKVYDNRLPAGQVIFEQNVAGTYTFTLEHKQNYEIAIVGAGGGACGGTYGSGHRFIGGAGASGAAFVGVALLEKGVYTVTVGAAGSGGTNGNDTWTVGTKGGTSTLILNNNVLINADGGEGGKDLAKRNPAVYGGKLTVNIQYLSATVKSDGVTISGYDAGGASLYNGYGKGGNGVYKKPGKPGVVGYFRLTTA